MAEVNNEVILDIKVNYEGAIDTLKNYRQRIDELREANKTLQKGNEEERKQYEANAVAIKELSYEMRVLQKETQNNVREQRSQEGSLKQLRAQLSQLTKQYDELSKEARNSAAGKELQKKIKAITEELKNAEAETDRFYRNVGNYENSIKNALGLNNNFANSIINLTRSGGGFKGMMEGAITSVKSFGTALTSLLANPAILAIGGIAGAGMAFKWFFDYNQGIAEATRLTKEFMGIEGDALRSVRDNIQATADVFGKDYKEVLTTVDALMAQYHISAEEAIKVVNDGFVAGADLSGNFLSQLNQYAPAFHDAGVGADELVAILAQTRSGIFSEGGMDVISTASKRIREMSKSTAQALDDIGISSRQVEKDLQSGAKSTFDVMQEVSARLKELPQNGQEVGLVLKDVFGKTAAEGGLQMIETLDTMTTKIEEVKAVTGEYGQMQEEQLEAQRELNDAVSTLFDVSEGGFETVIGYIKIFLTRFLTKVIKGITDVINWVIELYNESIAVRGAVQLIIAAVKTLWSAVKMAFNNIIDAVKMVGSSLKGLAILLAGIFTLNHDLIKAGWKEFSAEMSKGMKHIQANVKEFAGDTAEAAVTAWNNTMTKEKVKPLTGAIGVESGTGGGDTAKGVSGKPTISKGMAREDAKAAAKAAKEAAREAAKAAKEAEKRAKEEREQLAHLESLKSQLIDDLAERQRAQINAQYDKQIADIRAKLGEKGKHTADAERAMTEQIIALNQLRNKALAKVDEDEMRRMVELENRRINLKLQAVRKGAAEEYALRLQQMDNEQAMEAANIRSTITNEQTKNAMLLDLDAAYQEKRLQLADQYRQKEREEMQLAMRNDIQEKMMSAQTELERLQLELEQAQFLRDTAEQKREESEEQWRARRLQLEQDYQQKQQAIKEKELEVEQAKTEAMASLTGSLSDMLGEFGESNKDFAVASKMLAIAEVAIQQGLAIANAVRAATEGSHSWWEAAAAIGVGIATVTSSIMSALKTIKSAKFATGGRVFGAGTATSDSIPAWLSNGESVINARSSAMFAPLLSAVNQLGGGIPIVGYSQQSQIGEDFLASAVAKGMAYAPRPVVDVQEITSVANRVEVIENLGTL